MFAIRFRSIFASTALVLVALVAGSCAAGPVVVKPDPMKFGSEFGYDLAASGRQIVQRECMPCHAIDRSSAGSYPDAPPLNSVLSRYNRESLAEDFISGVRVGHRNMPVFDFNVIAADAVIAYLESISTE